MCLELLLIVGLGYEVGPTDDANHYGNGPVATISAECVVVPDVSFVYNHTSSLLSGFPFNHKEDKATTDVWSINYTIKLK